MESLHAFDLTELPGTDSLWRRRHDPHGEPAPVHAGLAIIPGRPASGFSSPLGFWFADATSWTTGPPRLRVEFLELDDRSLAKLIQVGLPRKDPPGCRTARARLKAPAVQGPARRRALPLTIEIDSNVARIGVDAQTWASVGQTVLLAVALHWRLEAIDRTLDELSAWARDDLERNFGFAHAIRPRRSRELRARRRLLERLILDLPDFEGFLTNPRGHLIDRRAVRRYRGLCAWLGLDSWRREIDERVEVVESIFGSLAESLNHFQSLAFQIAFELAIVVLLLLDVGLYFLDAISSHGP
jgi:hypothetical protein